MKISGLGLIGGFGLGQEALLTALQQGGQPNSTMAVQTSDGPRDLPVYEADVTPVRQYVKGGALRRMNRYARLAVLGACQALDDADWDRSQPSEDLGLVIASGFGASKSTFDFLDTMIDDEGRCPSPTQFSNSVHSSAAAHLSIVLQSHGPCLTVSQFEMSPISALITAQDWLAQGRVKAVLFGAVDELCPVLGYCYDQFFGQRADGPLDPTTWEKQTSVAGEGAVFMLLTAEDQNRSYGQIESLDWCRSTDVNLDKERTLVLGADGQICTARAYRRFAQAADKSEVYSTAYGSLPGGQAFDLASAALLARAGQGAQAIQSIKCDAQGSSGVISCRFD